MKPFAPVMIAAVLALAPTPSLAEDFRTGDIVVANAWTRATPKGADVAAGYLVIRNTGAVDDRLTSVNADFATSAQAHEMRKVDGVMMMRKIEGGLVVPAHGAVTLAPGASHIMFAGLKQPLKLGDTVKATLAFEHAGAVTVALPVLDLGARGPAPAN